jgi:hypothetical protein
MSEILNYTGKRIGLTNGSGSPIEVLPSHGNARCEIEKTTDIEVGRIQIYRKTFGKVRGLPNPDLNHQKLYIVSREVAEAIGNTRYDLLVPEDPFPYEGVTFYKTLVNV